MLGIEQQFAANVIAIFWSNPIIAGMVALGFFFAIVMLLRIPMIIAAPLYATALIISIPFLPQEFIIIVAFVIGIIIASFIYSIWER